MDKHVLILGRGTTAERVVFETYQRNEAIEAVHELFCEWLENWSDSDIDSDEARAEKPYHLVDCGDGELLEYW
jgi:hypothetical protein